MFTGVSDGVCIGYEALISMLQHQENSSPYLRWDGPLTFRPLTC